MSWALDARTFLSGALGVIAIHSGIVGLGLLVLPSEHLGRFGFAPVTEPFFVAQGAVFHLVMCVAYSLAAACSERFYGLVLLAIFTKLSAAVFLLLYFAVFSSIWIVLVSGLVDASMGAAIFVPFVIWRRGIR